MRVNKLDSPTKSEESDDSPAVEKRSSVAEKPQTDSSSVGRSQRGKRRQIIKKVSGTVILGKDDGEPEQAESPEEVKDDQLSQRSPRYRES